MRKFYMRAAACAALSLLWSSATSAHVTLETPQAASGSTYKAVLRVGHGCGSAPTTAIRVRIPEGMIAVKPMPKAGWELTVKVAPYPQPVKYFESTLTEGVTEIAWTGGSLPDAWYDEFVFRGRLPDAQPGARVWFPVIQECADKANRWIEIPAAGRKADDYEHPAPAVEITAKP